MYGTLWNANTSLRLSLKSLVISDGDQNLRNQERYISVFVCKLGSV